MSNKTVKRICFTIHDYKREDVKRLCKLDSEYLIIGYEVCPKTKKRHIQGFVNLKKKVKFNTAKTLIGKKAHLEAAKGSDDDNRRYCSKEGEFIEQGEPSKAGKRNDLKLVVETLYASGGNLGVVARAHPEQYIRYFRGIRELRDVVASPSPRSDKTLLFTLWGEPGSGKSCIAHALSQEFVGQARSNTTDTESIFYKPRGDWWDGYHQQPVVIIDDFYGWIKYDELLKITDRYPYQVPVKGAYQVFNSRLIIITSNKRVEDWYSFTNYDPTALLRRHTAYKRVSKYGGSGAPVPCGFADFVAFDGLYNTHPDLISLLRNEESHINF